MSTASELEERVRALELGNQYEVTQAAVRKVEEEFLVKLREIRAALVEDQQNGGSISQMKEMEELLAENERLKKRNAKLEYRVKHMLSSMEELYAKSSGKQ